MDILWSISNILILLLILIGFIALQIFLSNKESKWPGLILPTINVCLSLIVVLGLYFYDQETPGQVAIRTFSVLLAYNIPTLVFLGIYFACREKRKKRKEIEKMNIQDL